MALGGEAEARLVARLGLRTSPDTLLRLVQVAPIPEAPAPQILGVDAWAWRRMAYFRTCSSRGISGKVGDGLGGSVRGGGREPPPRTALGAWHGARGPTAARRTAFRLRRRAPLERGAAARATRRRVRRRAPAWPGTRAVRALGRAPRGRRTFLLGGFYALWLSAPQGVQLF